MYQFIVNPNARSGLGLSIWNRVEEKLKKENVSYQVHFTERSGHATEIARRLTEGDAPVTLVVLGGDGSVDEVVGGICCPEKTTLGYIPIGSSNDFARGLGLPADSMAALDVLLHSKKTRPLNLGLLHYGEHTRRFAVSAGIGYDADICHQVSVSRLKVLLNRIGLGKLAYVGLSLKCLFRCKPDAMTVTLTLPSGTTDGAAKVLHFRKAYFASAFNLPYEGGGCKFCPDALPDDDYLDLIVVADVPKLQALAILPTVFSGRHTHLPGVHIYRFKRAEIASDVPLPIHSDGEPIAPAERIAFSLETERIRVITN